MQRRERTRRLIELGGLVEKSGLRELMGSDDPDAALYGALLTLKAELAGTVDVAGDEAPSPAERLACWRHAGRRALRDAAIGAEPGEAR